MVSISVFSPATLAHTAGFSPSFNGSLSESCPKRLGLTSAWFQFAYSFGRQQQLTGRFEGDLLCNRPNIVFNLRQLQATYHAPEGLTLWFDHGFGQVNLASPEVLLSGANARTGALFSINYRCQDAVVYGGDRGRWLASGWRPQRWQINPLAAS